ncbi:hypothetical protein LCGC14_1858410, partial [marine sediment metagenome]
VSKSDKGIEFVPEAIDVTPAMLGEKEIAMRERATEVGSAIATGASPIGDPATIGEVMEITVSDFVEGDYDEEFVVLMEGDHGIILIENEAFINKDGDEYVFANPNNIWRTEDRISTAQLTYLLDQFDTNIYNAVTGVFGNLTARGDEGQKVWILIHNIRDESYYEDYQYYVAGYFSSAENAMNNKNMFHIDSYDWAHRCGTPANPWFVDDASARPNLYEGTFAHEFEHMVHFDVDPDEPSWVDEGLADLAGYLSGYGHSDGHLMYYMAYHPMTSLTFWGGELEDYGISYLFQLYLFEHFGGIPFVSALVNESANGIEGVENTLAAFGYTESFDEIFDRFTIANYLDDPNIGDGEYSYEHLAIGSGDTRGWTIDYAVEYWNNPPNGADIGLKPKNSNWFYGIEPQPYTAQYFHIRNRMPATIVFDGDDISGTAAHSGEFEWYSGANAWAWQNFGQTFTLPSASAITLDFYTFFDIEGDWDYGYVELHVGDEWYTLADSNGNTVSTVPHRQDNPNVPDGREPMDYLAAGRWNAFTGFSGGYIPISMDLTEFAGQEVEILFTLWQDGAFTLQNMYVDDISITTDIGVFLPTDDVEDGPMGWSSTGWYITDGLNDNNFGLTLLEKVNYWGESIGEIINMDIDPITERGTMFLEPIWVKDGFMRVAIITNHADHILTSHYDFRLYGWYQWFR